MILILNDGSFSECSSCHEFPSMSDPAGNARALFPTIQITLISIIVALALQQLLNLLPTIDALWAVNVVAARLWCQALVGFVIIVKMWTGFVLTAVVSERVPRAIDLLGPIGVLVFVDAQIACIDVEHTLRWWYVLGIGSLFAAAFIAGQMALDSVTRGGAPGFSPADRIAAAFRRPATVEATLGVLALVIAMLHNLVHFGEAGLLVVGAIYLLAQLISSIGPIVGSAKHVLLAVRVKR